MNISMIALSGYRKVQIGNRYQKAEKVAGFKINV